MRIRLQRLIKILIVIFLIGSVVLLTSVFRDLDGSYERFKLSHLYNSKYLPEQRVNVSNRYEHVTIAAPVTTINRITIDSTVRVHGDCPSVINLPTLNIKDTWQAADDKKQVYVFSAYLEGSKIRIIGAKTATSPPLFCQHYYRFNQSNASIEIVAASALAIPEGHGRRYTATYCICDVPGSRKPAAVSLVDKKCRKPLNILSITSYSVEKKRNFTVCTTPLNYRYNRAHELIEWVELNRILGADFFTLYNYTTGPDVDNVLNFYIKQGILEVVPWKLPMGVNTWPKTNTPVEIHYFGQLAASNDCLRRNRDRSNYVVVLDLDEFIIPRKELTWRGMMKRLPDSGAYVFCNTFFREDWNDTTVNFDDKDKAVKFKLNTLLKLERETKIFSHNLRSKYIVKPNSVETLGIHQTWRMAGNQKIHKVSNQDALLHHYRNWENPFDKVPRTNDRVVLDKFGPDLIDKVSNMWKILAKS